jgi:hypothetical protein
MLIDSGSFRLSCSGFAELVVRADAAVLVQYQKIASRFDWASIDAEHPPFDPRKPMMALLPRLTPTKRGFTASKRSFVSLQRGSRRSRCSDRLSPTLPPLLHVNRTEMAGCGSPSRLGRSTMQRSSRETRVRHRSAQTPGVEKEHGRKPHEICWLCTVRASLAEEALHTPFRARGAARGPFDARYRAFQAFRPISVISRQRGGLTVPW